MPINTHMIKLNSDLLTTSYKTTYLRPLLLKHIEIFKLSNDSYKDINEYQVQPTFISGNEYGMVTALINSTKSS